MISPVSAASITLTIPSSLSLNITPSVSGTFAKSDQPGTISVTTDSKAGYTLGIKAKSDNSLVNGSSKLASITNQLSEEQYQASGNVNTWGFLPSKLNGQANTNFLAGPTAGEATVLDITDAPNPSGANTYNLTLGAKVDSTIPSGTYSNTFIISATTNELPLKKLQEWGWKECDALEEHEIVELEDTRDGNTYKVAKLKDGKCWMIENLRLGDSKLTNHILTKDNTDITADTYNLPNSSSSGFSNDTAQNIYVPDTDSGDYKVEYGGYYTWMAATAGTGGNSGNAPSSICPKGWRLPTGDSGGEFQTMASKYNNNSGNSMLHDTSEIPGFYLAGDYGSSSPEYQGFSGGYWSSTAYSSGRAHNPNLYSGGISPTVINNKRVGFSIRCVARERTMQNVSEWGSDVKEHEIVTAKDERDGNTYKVTRLRDGKLWMIDNLRLGDSKLTNRNLTSSNTDITAASYNLPNSSTSGFSDYTAQNVYVPDSASGDYKVEYGGYYTWMAATAGTGGSSGNASSSICPKGWRLPTGGSSGEFQTMASKYNNNSGNSMLHDTNEIPGFYLAGDYSGSSPGSQGSLGYYWSSTADGSSNAYNLDLRSGRADPANRSLKYYGFSICCISPY